MRIYTVLAFVFLFQVGRDGGNSVLAQGISRNEMLQVFSLIFDTCNFDSRYYIMDSETTFAIIREGSVLDMLDSLDVRYDVLQLKNGNKMVFNSKGWMFMADIRNYLRFDVIAQREEDFFVELELLEFDGFSEKSHGSMLFSLLYKNDSWVIVRRKMVR